MTRLKYLIATVYIGLVTFLLSLSLFYVDPNVVLFCALIILLIKARLVQLRFCNIGHRHTVFLSIAVILASFYVPLIAAIFGIYLFLAPENFYNTLRRFCRSNFNKYIGNRNR